MDSYFNTLYARYYQRVYYAALKVTSDSSLAEDILQETFMKAYDKLHEVKEEGKVGAWLSTIATRKAIDLIRKEKRHVYLPLEELPFSDPSSGVEELVELRLQTKEAIQLIAALPPKLRVVLKLGCMEGKSEKEIAEALDVTLACVKSRMYRARMALRNLSQHSHTA
ncbi:RNA polymerase sigma factor [Halobacillus salinus]|uniref:RNA polymerase sigma factor n=1 Tax=Halobacillus salinus TaxID=192814 RepID=UPI0015916158|nr:sigma-70 family RNA polymerase sigma factor [Halobacillus salinus]